MGNEKDRLEKCPTCVNPSSDTFCATHEESHRHFFNHQTLKNHLKAGWLVSQGFCHGLVTKPDCLDGGKGG